MLLTIPGEALGCVHMTEPELEQELMAPECSCLAEAPAERRRAGRANTIDGLTGCRQYSADRPLSVTSLQMRHDAYTERRFFYRLAMAESRRLPPTSYRARHR